MSDKICEICKNPIEEGEEIIPCPDCGREFHKKYWRLTGKCCVSEECRQKAHERKEAEKQEKEKEPAEQNTEAEKSVKLCPKCGKELNDEEIFCGKCGEPVSKEPEEAKKRICSKCGRVLNEEEVFCCKCGTEYTDTPDTKNADKKPIYKRKWFVVSAVCVCAVAAIAIIAGVISANQFEPCTYHSWETVEVIKEATCTEQGLENQKCSVCKEKREHVIFAKGHQWKTSTVKKATCTEDGSEEKVCSVCGHKETKTISGSHNWIEATCTSPRTCSVCGKTEGEKLEHDFYDGKCVTCKYEVPLITYKGVKITQTPFKQNGITVLSAEIKTDSRGSFLVIKVRNDTDKFYEQAYIRCKTVLDNIVISSDDSIIDNLGPGETALGSDIYVSISKNIEYHLSIDKNELYEP